MAKRPVLKKDVVIGETYVVKVSGKLAEVKILREEPVRKFTGNGYSGRRTIKSGGGWWGVNLKTGREVRIKSAAKLRLKVSKQATTEPAKSLPAATGPTTQPAAQDSQRKPQDTKLCSPICTQNPTGIQHVWQGEVRLGGGPDQDFRTCQYCGNIAAQTACCANVRYQGDICALHSRPGVLRSIVNNPTGCQSVVHAVQHSYDAIQERTAIPPSKWADVARDNDLGTPLSQQIRRDEWNQFLDRLMKVEARIEVLEKRAGLIG